MNSSEKFLVRALRREISSSPPMWLMRQAGRYLKEYRDVRKNAGSFLDLCYTPKLAAEVTLQPIRRFGFNASIIFSDILVIPHAMGVGLDYREGEGPVLEKIANEERIKVLSTERIHDTLSPVYEAIRRVRQELPESTTLIGFAGAPWTVATYMVEGGSSKDYASVKGLAYADPELFQVLIDKLVEATISYLSAQIDAGAEVIQIFDSWAGVLAEQEFDRWVIAPTVQIIQNLKEKHPDIPIIGFPKGAGILYQKYVKETGVDGVSIDATVPLSWAAEVLQPHVCVQGNLDPVLLAADKQAACKEACRIIDVLGNGPFIFNLGHGILPHTPVEHVERLIEEVRNF